MPKTITIEYPLAELEKDGIHIHMSDGSWCLRGYHPDGYETGTLTITEDEIYRGILKARREARIARARLKNLETLLQEVCKQLAPEE